MFSKLKFIIKSRKVRVPSVPGSVGVPKVKAPGFRFSLGQG